MEFSVDYVLSSVWTDTLGGVRILSEEPEMEQDSLSLVSLMDVSCGFCGGFLRLSRGDGLRFPKTLYRK